MNDLETLEHEVSTVRRFVENEEERLRSDPQSREAQYFLEAKKDHLGELQQKVRLLKAERNKELLEIRLLGETVSSGSIPLTLLARLANPINEFLTRAACRAVTDGDIARETVEDVRGLLDLRLAGISAGSTKLLITGNVAPDLTGESILENALRSVFSLLNSDNESFYDAVDGVGVKSAKSVGDFLRQIERNGLAVEMNWSGPNSRYHSWRGMPDDVSRIKYLLGVVQEPSVIDEEIVGEVRKLADTGRIELRTQVMPSYKIRYSKDKYEIVRDLHLGQIVRAHVKTFKYFDQLGLEKLRAHHLLTFSDQS